MPHFFAMTSSSGKKLLVADDSLTIQKVIRLALSSEGYDIQAVSDGNEALQQISVFRPDVILIDVSLPGQSAFEVKSAFNASPDPAHARFILMSSAFEQIDEAQAGAVGFDGRLTKPFDPAHLRQVIHDVLGAAPEPLPDELPPLPGDDSGLWSRELPGGTDALHTLSQSEPHLTEPEILPPPPFAPTQLSEHVDTRTSDNPDEDIRNLTESTIRLSGLDDFNWSVKEQARKTPSASTHEPASPSYTPSQELEHLSDLSGSNFKIEPPRSSHITSPGADLGLPMLDPEELREAALGTPEAASGITGVTPPPPPPLIDPNVVPLTTGQVEALIQKQLKETLEQMARKILPEVAERVIKQEIHRMLQEQP